MRIRFRRSIFLALLPLLMFTISIEALAFQSDPDINVEQDSTNATVPHGGVLYVGGNSTEGAQLQNAGGAPLSITWSGLTPLFGDAVRVEPNPIIPENAEGGTGTIPASGNVPFTTTCESGDAANEFNGEVVIDSDDPDTSRYVFLIRCNADQGTETSEINVLQGQRTRLNGATISFRAGQRHVFRIENLGENTLFTRLPDVTSYDHFLPMGNIFNRTNIAIDVPGLNDAQVLIGAGETPYFEVDCNASVVGSVSTTLFIHNSDPDDAENPYNLTLVCSDGAPEIAVSGPNGAIDDGAAAFTLVRGETITFTVTNSGNLSLFLDQVAFDPAEGGFSVTDDFDNVDLPPGQSDAVTIQCDTDVASEITRDMQIVNDDPDEAPFNISLTCSPPEVAVSADSVDLTDGDAELIFAPGESVVFTVTNVGHKEALLLNGLALNPAGAGFTISTPLSDGDMSLGPGESDTFTVQCDAGVATEALVEAQLGSSDADENPFNIDLICSPADVAVSANGDELTDGAGEVSFVPGQSRTFTVTNESRKQALALTSLALIPAGGGFTITAPLSDGDMSLAPGESDSFTIQCDTNVFTEISAEAQLGSSDADENPFNIALTCKGDAPDLTVLQAATLLANGDTVAFEAGETLDFTVRNDGIPDLSLTSLSVTGDGFSLVNNLGDNTLSSGETTSFSIQCAADVDDATGTATLTNNDPDENPFSIALTCTAPPPEPEPEPPPDDGGDDDDDDRPAAAPAPSGPTSEVLLCGSNPLVSASSGAPNPLYCRMLVGNGQFLGRSEEIGNGDLLAMSLWQVVDIFDLAGNTSGPINVCLQGGGTLYYLDATQQPRMLQALGGAPQSGFTCATIPHPGLVALVGGASAAPVSSASQAPAAAPSLVNCMVTTRARMNLRSTPDLGDNVILLVPYNVTLTATQRLSDWFNVDYLGTPGWVSAGYVTPGDGC